MSVRYDASFLSEEAYDESKLYVGVDAQMDGVLAEGAENGFCVELLALLDELGYPAWLETVEGRIKLFNGKRLIGGSPRRSEGGALDASVSLRERLEREFGALEAISLAQYPVDLGDWVRGGEAVRLAVACRQGEEQARDQSVVAALWRWVLRGMVKGTALPELTPQQQQIYRLLCNKLSYKEIAARLGVAHSTIRVQVATLRKVLGEERVPLLRR